MQKSKLPPPKQSTPKVNTSHDWINLENDTIIAYIDGSSMGVVGIGGWACIFTIDGNTVLHTISGGAQNTTNNQMELTAAIEALKLVNPKSRLIVYTDSQYVCKGITEWIKGWKKKGWRNAARKPVLNKELWLELDALNNEFANIEWCWVRGHDGNAMNELADKLANEAKETVRDE